MEISLHMNPGPRAVPDLRPVADAMGIARDPRPDLPLGAAATAPIPPPQVVTTSASSGGIAPVERALKPYGVTMLPTRELRQGQLAVNPTNAGPGSDSSEPSRADPATMAQARAAGGETNDTTDR